MDHSQRLVVRKLLQTWPARGQGWEEEQLLVHPLTVCLLGLAVMAEEVVRVELPLEWMEIQQKPVLRASVLSQHL